MHSYRIASGVFMDKGNTEVAEYIGDMCAELGEMATQAGFEYLAKLLALAVLEASKLQQRDVHH